MSVPQSSGRQAVNSTVLVFLGTGIANMALLIASVIVAQALGPADFAAIGAMLALLLIISIAPFALIMVIARDVAMADTAAGLTRAARYRLTNRIAIGVTGVGVALSVPLAAILDVPILLLVLTTASAYPLITAAVPRGLLQGRQEFRSLALNFAVEGIVRLVVVVTVLALGGGLIAVGAAPLIATTTALVMGWRQVRPIVTRSVFSATARQPWDRGLIGAAALSGGLFALTNVDLLFAKARMPAVTAGDYAVGAMFGKIVFFLPIAVGAILVPAVAKRRELNLNTLPLLGWACVASSVACVGATGLAAVGATPIRMVLGGPLYPDADDLLVPFGLAMTALALAALLGSYLVTMARESAGWAFLGAALTACVALSQVDATPRMFVGTLLAISLVLSASVGYLAVRVGRRALTEP